MGINRRKYSADDEEYEEYIDYPATYSNVHQSLLKDRIVFVTEDITVDLASRITAVLIYLDTQNQEPITMYINSQGGEIEGFMQIYDTMHLIKSPIKTICLGEASSCAAMILVSGTPGMRFATQNSRIMIHQIWVESSGGCQTGTELAIESKNINDLKKKMTVLIARHSGQNYETVYNDCEHDCYFSAQEAKKYGLVDDILKPHKDIPKLKKVKKVKAK
jgi:ATP-dependent Clp protease protease subunit